VAFGDPFVFLIGSVLLIPALFIAVPVHEIGHGLAATFMGDPSPRNRGYFRLPPQRYLNIYGVLAVFLANVGWGSPIPVNEYRLQGAGRKVIWALGGPIANLIVAAVFGVILRVLLTMGIAPSLLPGEPLHVYAVDILYGIYFLNLAIFAFQLLPIPGLDGWRVVEAIFRHRHPRFFFDVSAHTQTIWMICAAIIIIGPWLLHFDILGSVVAIFFQPFSMAIVGQCSAYTTLHPCLPLGF
jgi:Zn-dependent protease